MKKRRLPVAFYPLGKWLKICSTRYKLKSLCEEVEAVFKGNGRREIMYVYNMWMIALVWQKITLYFTWGKGQSSGKKTSKEINVIHWREKDKWIALWKVTVPVFFLDFMVVWYNWHGSMAVFQCVLSKHTCIY